jgi:hypothetical protein
VPFRRWSGKGFGDGGENRLAMAELLDPDFFEIVTGEARELFGGDLVLIKETQTIETVACLKDRAEGGRTHVAIIFNGKGEETQAPKPRLVIRRDEVGKQGAGDISSSDGSHQKPLPFHGEIW